MPTRIMFPPRVFVLFAIGLVSCTALPAQTPQFSEKPVPKPVTESWFEFPFFSTLFGHLWKIVPDFSGIGSNIASNDGNFLVNVSVTDYKTENLEVKVKDGFIFIKGWHGGNKTKHELFDSHFFYTYSLPVNSSAADVKAELSTSGWLIVTAPISEAPIKGAKDQERMVEITETEVLYQPTVENPTSQSDDDEPTSEAADDRKGLTTMPPENHEEANRIE